MWSCRFEKEAINRLKESWVNLKNESISVIFQKMSSDFYFESAKIFPKRPPRKKIIQINSQTDMIIEPQIRSQRNEKSIKKIFTKFPSVTAEKIKSGLWNLV